MGGVGKTQIAAEYVYKSKNSYDLVWWITAEQAGLIGEQFASLAKALRCADPDAGVEAVQRAVLAELRERTRWLLVFDNVEEPEDVTDWLPAGPGHVLITSRTHRWTDVAVPIEVNVLVRNDSLRLLSKLSVLSGEDAGLVAEAVGDLPLALVQAAAFIADTGIPAYEYAALLKARAREILDHGRPATYPRSLAAVTQLAFDRLRVDSLAASQLAESCAFLAPEPILQGWFTNAFAELPAPLCQDAADPVAWRFVIAQIGRHGLVRVEPGALQMHRLTQAIIRNYLSEEQRAAARDRIQKVLANNYPGDPQDRNCWLEWAQLLPHLIAVEPISAGNQSLRHVVADAAWYLAWRGDARNGYELAGRLYEQWKVQLGPDDGDTLWAGSALAYSLRAMGRHDEAHRLGEEAYGRYRRLRGDDHPDTLTSASNLAASMRMLGEIREARKLNADTWARRRRVLGDDHPDTLTSASNLAASMRMLGEIQQAWELDERTLRGYKSLLGDNHPDTLASASNQALSLYKLGMFQAARELGEDNLARQRLVLGDDHPDTLASASNLASILRALNRLQEAQELDEDILARRRRVLGEDHPDTFASAEHVATGIHRL